MTSIVFEINTTDVLSLASVHHSHAADPSAEQIAAKEGGWDVVWLENFLIKVLNADRD